MTLEFIAAAQDYKQRWEALKDFYRWRKYTEEKPEEFGSYQTWCKMYPSEIEIDAWMGDEFFYDSKRKKSRVEYWTNTTPPITGTTKWH
jgi:hypothetical protein